MNARSLGPSPYLTTKQLAQRWGVSTGSLANTRSMGLGIPHYKIGSRVRYALSDIEAYEAACRVEAIA